MIEPYPKFGCPGLVNKLYWRRPNGSHLWHCFEKAGQRQYESLCGCWTIKRSGGQAIDRPAPYMRCARCDVEEMRIRGKEESLPTRKSK